MAAETVRVYSAAKKGYITVEKVVKTDEEWRKILTPEQFEITRKRGTERSCSGAFWNNHREGTYQCVCCGNDLFQSVNRSDVGMVQRCQHSRFTLKSRNTFGVVTKGFR